MTELFRLAQPRHLARLEALVGGEGGGACRATIPAAGTVRPLLILEDDFAFVDARKDWRIVLDTALADLRHVEWHALYLSYREEEDYYEEGEPGYNASSSVVRVSVVVRLGCDVRSARSPLTVHSSAIRPCW